MSELSSGNQGVAAHLRGCGRLGLRSGVGAHVGGHGGWGRGQGWWGQTLLWPLLTVQVAVLSLVLPWPFLLRAHSPVLSSS